MIFSYMLNMHDMHNMQTNMQHPHFNMQHSCFNMQHPHFNMLNMLSMSKNMASMDKEHEWKFCMDSIELMIQLQVRR